MKYLVKQQFARLRSAAFLLGYAAASVGTALACYPIGWLIYQYIVHVPNQPVPLWQPQGFWISAGLILLYMIGTSLAALRHLRDGGLAVIRLLRARLIWDDTVVPSERVLYHVVEEMAIAASVAIPHVAILDHERGVNGFVAGYSQDDAVIGVTAGALQHLTRDELQGLVGHQFSHLLNGDMRANTKLIAGLSGIESLSKNGRRLMSSSAECVIAEGCAILFVPGIILWLVGCAGEFVGKLMQGGFSRHRKLLADASAVEFTRNPDAVAQALLKVAQHGSGLTFDSTARLHGHLFFQSTGSAEGGLLATHPSLAERVKAIWPAWDGILPKRVRQPSNYGPESLANMLDATKPKPPKNGSPGVDDAISRSKLPNWRYRLRQTSGAKGFVYALLSSGENRLEYWKTALLPADLTTMLDLRSKTLNLPTSVCQEALELGIPALRRMPPEEFERFTALLTACPQAESDPRLLMVQKRLKQDS